MFLEGWIGFLELEKGRSRGEMPVLGNSKVMGQVRVEHSVLGQWEKREKGKEKGGGGREKRMRT